jgi:choice-of-anchor A domain-containing protein
MQQLPARMTELIAFPAIGGTADASPWADGETHRGHLAEAFGKKKTLATRATRWGVFGLIAGLAAGPAHAGPLTSQQILSEFNAVIGGTFTSSSDVEGRLVANTLAGGATFYNMPRGTAAGSSFGAVNAITVGAGVNANVNNGGSVNVQGANNGKFSFNGGGSEVNTPPFAITDFTAPLTATATQLFALAPNSSISSSDPNNFTFNATPDASGTAVFSLSTALLSTARNLNFNIGSATTIIIDVTGSSFTDSTNFNASAFLNSHVIWDFDQATSLSFSGWHGTVLAPLATVSNSSAMEGSLFAQNFNGNGELHDYTYAGSALDPAPAPEPASLAIFGLGLLGLGFAHVRWGATRWNAPGLVPPDPEKSAA